MGGGGGGCPHTLQILIPQNTFRYILYPYICIHVHCTHHTVTISTHTLYATYNITYITGQHINAHILPNSSSKLKLTGRVRTVCVPAVKLQGRVGMRGHDGGGGSGKYSNSQFKERECVYPTHHLLCHCLWCPAQISCTLEYLYRRREMSKQ